MVLFSRSRMVFGCSILSLLTIVYAKAITVSNSPLAAAIARMDAKKKQIKYQQLVHLSGSCGKTGSENAFQVLQGRGGSGVSESATKATTTITATTTSAWVDGLKNSLASALASAFSKTILAPFDTVKTLQQFHQTTPEIPSLTLLEAAKKIMARPGGFMSFYVCTKICPPPIFDTFALLQRL